MLLVEPWRRGVEALRAHERPLEHFAALLADGRNEAPGAEGQAACTCDAMRGCPRCFARAERLVGALVRDDYGREWGVTEADQKDGFPTVGGERFWARLEDVEVLDEAG